MSSSDSDSPLSSPPETDDDRYKLLDRPADVKKKRATKKKPAITKIKLKAPVPARSPSPPPKKRKKEPPHVFTLADSPELAFLVMFRSRFADAFKGVPNLGCQDIERGIVDSTPSEPVEQFLCRLISLVLNRKKPVERGHHTRALEEALHTHNAHWPAVWEGKSPMSGGRNFADMDAGQRLVLLKALTNWALMSSEQIRGIIQENYKGSRREDDINVPISVQPWGRDGDKRRYWLIEGREDTPFRLYRESNPALKNIQWISIAGTIDELRTVSRDLQEEDGTKHALALRDKIESTISRFEEGEIRRKKREYRASRKAFFNQTNGVSLYEGRTRGKRIKYTFSDDEGGKDSEADETRSRRGGRSLRSSPGVTNPDAPRFTASGRQIRKPNVGTYGELKTNGGTSVDSTAANSENGRAEYRPYVSDGENGGDEDDGEEWQGQSSDDDADISEWDDTGFDDPLAEKKSLKIILKFKQDALPVGNDNGGPIEKPEQHKDGGDIAMADADAPVPQSADTAAVIANTTLITNGYAPPNGDAVGTGISNGVIVGQPMP